MSSTVMPAPFGRWRKSRQTPSPKQYSSGIPSGPGALSRRCRSESMWVPMWSPVTIMLLAVNHFTPYFAAPMRSANSVQVSYIAIDGRTTRGNATMSLCTRMLRSINFRAMTLLLVLLRGRHAAVEKQVVSGDEVRRGRGEKRHGRDDVVGLADPPERNAV